MNVHMYIEITEEKIPLSLLSALLFFIIPRVFMPIFVLFGLYLSLLANVNAVVDLHGTKTDIHSNKRYGICALDYAKVNIHLPFQHNTSHDNVREDRYQWGGGSIANINADGTFTHVVVEEEEEDDDY